MKIRIHIFIFCLFCVISSYPQKSTVKIGLLKYSGGGDWYANPTALPNLIDFCNTNLQTEIQANYQTIEVGSPEIFNFPYVHLTGHGNVVFSDSEVENLRNYLLSGGFLHIDDNYGLDKFIRREMKKVFPDNEFVELPYMHPVYAQEFKFENGLPKVHEHDGKAPQGFGLIVDNRLLCFYSYESDLGDGWEDAEVHNDPEEVRLQALKMGANIISYSFQN